MLVGVDVFLCAVFFLQTKFEVAARLVVIGLPGRHDLLGRLHIALAQNRNVCGRVDLLKRHPQLVKDSERYSFFLLYDIIREVRVKLDLQVFEDRLQLDKVRDLGLLRCP